MKRGEVNLFHLGVAPGFDSGQEGDTDRGARLSLAELPAPDKVPNLWNWGESQYTVPRLHGDLTTALFDPGKDDYLEDFDLRHYDRFTPEMAIRFEQKNGFQPSEAGYQSGAIKIFIARNKLNRFSQFIRKLDRNIKFFTNPLHNCGAPVLLLEMRVPPLLEFYYTRKFQASGLVLSAYPAVYFAADPGLEVLTQSSGKAYEILIDPQLKASEIDRRLSEYLRNELVEFAKYRRRTFNSLGRISELKSPLLTFRFQIIGPSLTTCNRGTWDKLVVQFIPRPSSVEKGAADFLFQISGFTAPGSGQRPADERFREKRLDDEVLKELQDLLGAYLAQKGWVSDDSQPPNSSAISCDR
jgi:hypothetical protein